MSRRKNKTRKMKKKFQIDENSFFGQLSFQTATKIEKKHQIKLCINYSVCIMNLNLKYKYSRKSEKYLSRKVY